MCILGDDKVFPFKLISPFESFCNPAIVLKIVVFPIPEGPSSEIISPCSLIIKFTSFTLFFLLAVKLPF